MRVNENSMFRRILGSKKENISGWNKQFSDLQNLYFPPSIIRVIIYERGWDGQGMQHCLSDTESWARIPTGHCLYAVFLVLMFRVGKILVTLCPSSSESLPSVHKKS